MKTLRERFWGFVHDTSPTACWLWRGAVTRKGYGQIRRGGAGSKLAAAHRVAWELLRGEIAVGLLVCHRCDVRRCVNPAHLFLGSALENARDAAAKGRLSHGAAHPNAKLTARRVAAIRRSHAPDTTLAARFGVSGNAVWRVRHNVTWKG